MMRLYRGIALAGRGLNALAGTAVVAMMLLTCLDVVLRLLRHPVPGAYEIISFLGTLVISFSLAYTSLEKGHIAVELLVEKLPRRVRMGMESLTSFIGAALFALIAKQSVVYAMDLRQSGEVSVTLTMPIHPFIFGVAAGSGLLCLVLLAEGLKEARRMVRE